MKNKWKFLSLLIMFLIIALTSCKRDVKVETIVAPEASTKTYTYTGSEITYELEKNDLYTIFQKKEEDTNI